MKTSILAVCGWVLVYGCSEPAVGLGTAASQPITEGKDETTTSTTSEDSTTVSTATGDSSATVSTATSATGSGGSGSSATISTATSATSSGGTSSAGLSYGEQAAEAVGDLLDAYCNREAECIHWCCATECTCDSKERRAECPIEARRWFAQHVDMDGPSCEATLTAWVACIANSSCEDVQAFMRAHPDNVEPGTPCHDEYYALTCNDFEPVDADYVVD